MRQDSNKRSMICKYILEEQFGSLDGRERWFFMYKMSLCREIVDAHHDCIITTDKSTMKCCILAGLATTQVSPSVHFSKGVVG